MVMVVKMVGRQQEEEEEETDCQSYLITKGVRIIGHTLWTTEVMVVGKCCEDTHARTMQTALGRQIE